MGWLSSLKRRKEADDDGAIQEASFRKNSDGSGKKRSLQVDHRGCTSSDCHAQPTPIEAWLDARRARSVWPEPSTSATSTEAVQTGPAPTTGVLSVTQAGATTLINDTYLAVKHLGSGTYGQVKLALNLQDQRLYAIKACRKGSASALHSPRSGSPRSFVLRRRRASSSSTCSTNTGCGVGGDSSQAWCPSPQISANTCSGATVRGLARSSSVNTLCKLAIEAQHVTAELQDTASRSCTPTLPGNIFAEARAAAASASAAATAFGLAASPAPGHVSTAAHAVVPPVASSTNRLLRPRSPPTDDVTAVLLHEVAIMKRLKHRNVVRLAEVIDDPASECLLLVMEYVEGGSLQQKQVDSCHWECLSEAEVWAHARDVMQGLEYLHLNGIVHSDLKPANLMCDRSAGVTKIGDFGSAVLMMGAAGSGAAALECRQCCGGLTCTPAFRSPESLLAGYRPSLELDMWALGVCLHLWLFGELPFKGAAPFLVYENIRSQALMLPETSSVSVSVRDLLSRLLEKDPNKRLTIGAALAHPWVTANGAAPLPPGAALEPFPSEGPWVAAAPIDPQTNSQCTAATAATPVPRQLALIDGNLCVADAMALVFRELRFAPGELLVQAGQPAEQVYLLARGEVELLQAEPSVPAAVGAVLLTGRAAVAAAAAAATAAPVAAFASISSGYTANAGSSFSSFSQLLPEAAEEEDEVSMSMLMGSRCNEVPCRTPAAASACLSDQRPLPCRIDECSALVSTCQPCTMPVGKSRLRCGSSSSSSHAALHDADMSVTDTAVGGSGHHSTTPPGLPPLSLASPPYVAPPLLLALKRAGDSLGLAALDVHAGLPPSDQAAAAAASSSDTNAVPVWRMTARARGEVVAYAAHAAHVRTLAQRHPCVGPALAAAAERGDTDLRVAAALRQLCLMGEGSTRQ